MFWPQYLYNWQKDRMWRSDSCYLGPYQAFKQKTSPLDTPFSRNIASKLLTFQWIFKEKDCSASTFNVKKKITPKKIPFSVVTVKKLCWVQNHQVVSSKLKKTRQFELFGNSDLAELEHKILRI
jgi:hypothetical protein